MEPTAQHFLELLSIVESEDSVIKDIIENIRESQVHKSSRCHEESLYYHLISTAEECQKYAERRGWWANGVLCDNCELDSVWIFFLCGFFHDIGKPGANRKPYTNSKKKVTKGHALIGAAILDNSILSSRDVRRVFGISSRDEMALFMSTNYHMCRSPKSDEIDKTRLKLLSNGLTKGAAHLMVALRYGDHHGKIPLAEFDHRVQQEYENKLLGFVTMPPDIMEGINKGILITVTGYSGTGKTTRARQLIRWMCYNFGFIENIDVFHVNRDNIIKELWGSHEEYRSDLRANAPIANRNIQNRVNDILAAHRVCILDTMGMMNRYFRTTVLADIHHSILRVDLWTYRYPDTFTEEETQTRMGMTIAEQRNINRSGVTNLMDPVGSDIKWVEVENLMETATGGIECSNTKQAHFSLPIGHKTYLGADASLFLLKNILRRRPSELPPPPLLEEDMSLHQLVERLLAHGLDAMKFFFESHAYSYTCQEALAPGRAYTVCIKYIDKKNRLWKPKWCREARGAAFLLWKNEDSDVFEVHPLKISLPRCVEVMTSEAPTQDMEDMSDVSYLDDVQQDVVKRFNQKPEEEFGDNEEWFLTEKVDGCLLVVSIIPANSTLYRLLKIIMVDEGGPLKHIWHVFTQNHLIIPATSGSIQVGDRMKTTLITAFNQLLLNTTISTTDTSADVIWEERLKKPFGEAFANLMGKNEERVTAIIEMVCEGRKCYDGRTHRELAVAYEYSRPFLLGVFLEDVYHPAHKLPEMSLNTPKSRIIKTPREAIDALNELDNLSHHDLTHPEGFIITRHDRVTGRVIASCKLKSKNYYKAHDMKYEKLFNKDRNKTLNSMNITDNFNLPSVFPEMKLIHFICNILPKLTEQFVPLAYGKVLKRSSELEHPIVMKKDCPHNVLKYQLYASSDKLNLPDIFKEYFEQRWDNLNTDTSVITQGVSKLLMYHDNYIRGKEGTVQIIKVFADLFNP